MSRPYNIFTLAVVIGLGVVSGGYIFRPAIEDLEKEKRGGPLSRSSGEDKVDTSEGSNAGILKVPGSPMTDTIAPKPDPVTQRKSDSASGTINSGLLNRELPPFLQPWDSRKR
ncbi:MAG: hypothetical protein Q9182_003535 [Xanthomendoza sp. 2 TL-2023]